MTVSDSLAAFAAGAGAGLWLGGWLADRSWRPLVRETGMLLGVIHSVLKGVGGTATELEATALESLKRTADSMVRAGPRRSADMDVKP